MSSTTVFLAACVAQSLVFCVVFYRQLFVVLPILFSHCIFCPLISALDYPFGIFSFLFFFAAISWREQATL